VISVSSISISFARIVVDEMTSAESPKDESIAIGSRPHFSALSGDIGGALTGKLARSAHCAALGAPRG
jgi:hypothetical protein